MVLWAVGKVIGAKGLRGELRLRLFRASNTYLSANRILIGEREHAVRKLVWSDGHTAVCTVDGLADRTQAEAVVGQTLYADPAWYAPGEGPIEQLLGARAIDADTGAPLGREVTAIDTNGAQDLLVLGDVMVPYVEALVPGVSVGADGRLEVRIRAIEDLLGPSEE